MKEVLLGEDEPPPQDSMFENPREMEVEEEEEPVRRRREPGQPENEEAIDLSGYIMLYIYIIDKDILIQ